MNEEKMTIVGSVLKQCELDAEGDADIPASVTAIGPSAFDGCKGLTYIHIPNSVTEIGHNAFFGCAGLDSVCIPASITHLEDSLFRGCEGLETIAIPYGVDTIGWRTFAECTGLSTVYISASVTRIGDSAFEGCNALKAIHCYWTDEMPYVAPTAFQGISAKLCVPAGYAEKYQHTEAFNGMEVTEE